MKDDKFCKKYFFLILLWVQYKKEMSLEWYQEGKEHRRVTDHDESSSVRVKTIHMKSIMSWNEGSFQREKGRTISFVRNMWRTISFVKNIFFWYSYGSHSKKRCPGDDIKWGKNINQSQIVIKVLPLESKRFTWSPLCHEIRVVFSVKREGR